MRPRKDRIMATRGKTPAPTGEPLVQLIPIDKVIPPTENRDDLGDMEQLIASVKARGVSQAILVRPNEDGTYQIVFGERRWRAAKEAGHTTIKAEIRELDDLEAALEQIAENMDRQDLTSLEKAKALRRALEAAKRQGVRLGQREWAARLGKSQATVSKYLTLLVIYTEFSAFKQAYDAGQVTDTDAVHLGRLVRQVGKQTEVVERVLDRGLRFGIENEVNAELKSHERRQARAKVMADLEAHGVILAPDDWRSTSARRLAVLDVDPEAHRSEPCHAVWVDSAGEAEPICMNPDRHAERPADASSPTGTERGTADSSPGVDRADRSEAPARTTPTTSGTTPSAGSDGPATQEARRRQQEEEERRARQDAERREREEAERARTAELQDAATKRHETLQTWLTSSGRLPRPLSDGYLFWQVVNLLADQTANTPDVCDLLQVEIGDSSSLGALLDHAKKGPEQLRRVALALVITWAEDRLRSEEDWLDPFIHEHYRLLSDLGYQPSEIETQKLARVGAEEPPDKPGEDAAEQGDT
jgi:ParB/RepB/Spo0J family partition protein